MLQKGIPELRHDWWWPRERSAFATLYEAYASGWFPFGIGSPDQYPQKYFLAEILYLALSVSSGIVALAAYVFLTALVVVRGAMRLIGARVSSLGKMAVAVFALFNPWVFNKIVAGHVSMVLAYGAIMFFVVEIESRDNDWRRLSLAFAGVALHLQFAVLGIFALVVDAMLRRRLLPLVSAVLVCSPALIGILGNYAGLRGSPLNYDWFTVQSVGFIDALQLRGYFARYDANFVGVFVLAPIYFGILALVGTFRGRAYFSTILTAILVLLVAAFVSGAVGPASALFRFVVVRLPEIGLFRELYDLVALIVIGYIVLARRSLEHGLVASGALVSTALLMAFWFGHGPSSMWVGAAEFERIPRPEAAFARYALIPGIQPFTYRGMGSGADPDTVDYGQARQPIDEVFPSYPIDVALGRSAAGDVSELEAVGVGTIYERSGFAAVDTRLDAKRYRHTVVRTLHPAAIVSIGDFPTVCSLCTDLDGGNVFFGDAGDSTTAIPGSRDTIDEARDWVDARRFFRYLPFLGQSFGGAFTTSSSATLSVSPARAILVNVSGVLRDSTGRIVAQGNGDRYGWYAIARRSIRLRCEGRCAVALEGPINSYPLNATRKRSHPLRFSRDNPWFVRVSVPPHASGTIRFRERFDSMWLAFCGARVLRHVRIDALFNGWFVPRNDQPQVVVLIEIVALAQFVCECVASLSIVVLAVGIVRNRPSRRLDSGRINA